MHVHSSTKRLLELLLPISMHETTWEWKIVLPLKFLFTSDNFNKHCIWRPMPNSACISSAACSILFRGKTIVNTLAERNWIHILCLIHFYSLQVIKQKWVNISDILCYAYICELVYTSVSAVFIYILLDTLESLRN